MSQKWKSYEQVATHLLDLFASDFGLDRVEGKQHVEGHHSGTKWEIDAKGVCNGNDGFINVECRRYTTSKQNQEKTGALAYRIIDTGADGGILVSPLGLQEGAERLAKAENIVEVRLDENSTNHEYLMKFLNKTMIGLHDTISVSDDVTAELDKENGTTEVYKGK